MFKLIVWYLLFFYPYNKKLICCDFCYAPYWISIVQFKTSKDILHWYRSLFLSVIMIVLQDDQLPEFVASLERDFPASFNIYFLARNKMRKHLDWPGISFVVDEFPNFLACIARTDPHDPTIPPFTNGYSIFLHARDAERLKQLLDQPNIVDWKLKIGVHNAQRPNYFEVVRQKCLSLGGEIRYSPDQTYYVESALFTGFRMKDIHFDVALYNEKDDVVAYIMQGPEGGMGAGYVDPEYRRRGFFKVVLFELLKELERQGDTYGYADVLADNVPSKAAMLSIGGFIYDNFEAAWFEFIPKGN
ncbi:hypothetical protein BV898_04539 [Hypsibius exemplaris]|uniref:N-acetyltransferase domain-containing protein n=1 Tax=Hypsibius exemplaris TaxID=2072580 RepID=A0A1W0X2N3_HYPEX|nr:hypothetical protein BV898_04539 [Hypsibius exemplaris]